MTHIQGGMKMTPFLQEGTCNNSVIRKDHKDKNKTSFIYRSPVMEDIAHIVKKIAPLQTPVFLFGSKGVGKKALANEIHSRSKVHFGPLVYLHCKNLPEEILNTEIFGFKGCETTDSSEGALRKADGGTLILDDADSLPVSIQEKLYRYLRTGEVMSVGSTVPTSIQARLIFTIHDKETNFQNKLTYKIYKQINPLRIEVPDLKDRREDITDLVFYFLSMNEDQSSKTKVSEPALDALKCYRWPGNLKELKDICERVRIFCKNNEVTVTDLPRYFFDTDKCAIEIKYDPSLKLSDISRLYILSALKHFPSKKRAAQALGITVKTLYNRIHEYGIFDKYSVHSAQIPE